MTASNFNLRNITPNVMSSLKRKALKQKISINSLILHIIEEDLDLAPKAKQIFHDLDHLAGTWSYKEKEAFDDNIKPFETIDKEFWA